MEILGVFDNKNVYDRYTVVFNEAIEVIGEEGPFYQGLALSPNGGSTWVEVKFDEEGDNSHLGREISFEELPEKVKQTVLQTLEELKGEEPDDSLEL